MTWKICKKSKLNSEKMWKILKKILRDMEIMENTGEK
jgi:predicted nucleic acid-binding protein